MSSSLSMPTIAALPAEQARGVYSVSVFRQDATDDTSPVVVEALCPRGTVLARTVVEHDGSREAAADLVLAGTPLVRCAGFAVDPLHKRKRIHAMVAVDVSDTVSDFQARLAAASGTYG